MSISDCQSRTPGAASEPRARNRSRYVPAIPIATCLACLALVVQAPVAGAAVSFTTPTPQIGLVPFAGDVYTFSSSGTLEPIEPASSPLSTPLYNEAGNPLNLTWGQFSSATATSYVWTDTVNGVTHTDFAIWMSGLLPNGVYSLFYKTFSPPDSQPSSNPVCSNESLVSLTSAFPQLQKPDSDSFVATGSGKALFIGRVAGNLLAATQLQETLIYHFDGQTYGPVPNSGEANNDCQSSFGFDAMRQLFIVQK